MRALVALALALSAAPLAAQSDAALSDSDLCLKPHKQGQEIGINACTKLIDAKTGTPEERANYRAMRGARLWEAEDIQGARVDFDAAVAGAAAPWQKAVMLTLRGQFLGSQKNTAQSTADFDGAIAADPKFGPAYFWRGEAFYSQDRFAEAQMYYDKAVSLRPKDPQALNGACWVRAADLRTELAKARELCTRAIAEEPTDFNIRDSRGMVGLQERNWSAAFEDYDAAAKAMPKFASPIYGRGLAAIAMGRRQEGQADLDAAVKLDPAVAADFAKRGLSPQDIGRLSSGW